MRILVFEDSAFAWWLRWMPVWAVNDDWSGRWVGFVDPSVLFTFAAFRGGVETIAE